MSSWRLLWHACPALTTLSLWSLRFASLEYELDIDLEVVRQVDAELEEFPSLSSAYIWTYTRLFDDFLEAMSLLGWELVDEDWTDLRRGPWVYGKKWTGSQKDCVSSCIANLGGEVITAYRMYIYAK